MQGLRVPLTKWTFCCKIFLPGCGTADARSATTNLAPLAWKDAKMAPLNPNNTPRFRVFYTTIGHQHSLQVRSPYSPAALGGFITNYFGAFGVTCATAVIDFVDFAPSGSDIFNPVTTGVEGTTFTGGTSVAESAAWEFTFIGRSSGGRRVRYSRFGALYLGTDYRIVAGESTPIDNVVAQLNAAGSNLVCIDGLRPVWKTYADCGVNDHWVKVLRP